MIATYPLQKRHGLNSNFLNVLAVTMLATDAAAKRTVDSMIPSLWAAF
jgi:hypothetical protein